MLDDCPLDSLIIASFDQNGQYVSGSSLSGSKAELSYPRFDYGYARKVSERMITETGIGGTLPIYSASFDRLVGVQDYDLQTILSESSAEGGTEAYAGRVGDKRVIITKVFYISPRAMWRFYGYYGGLNVTGDMHSYGQYADDTSFEVVPAWQNKLQAMAYEDSIYTRISHYSYEIHNNKLRLYPTPDGNYPNKLWIRFTVQKNSWEETTDRKTGADGVNNMNTLPFENVPYKHINAIGKQWIRRFALALAKEMLGQVRSKFTTIPIPGESVTLNGAALIGEGREEQENLRNELQTTLDELTYAKLTETDAAIADSAGRVMQSIPVPVFVG